MPEWFRRFLFGRPCKACQAKDDEVGRLYALLRDANAEIRSLTAQLLMKNDPVTANRVNPPERKPRPVVSGPPPSFSNSLATGGHLAEPRVPTERMVVSPGIGG